MRAGLGRIFRFATGIVRFVVACWCRKNLPLGDLLVTRCTTPLLGKLICQVASRLDGFNDR